MKIALVGFGKMGQMIARCAEEKGHKICLTADPFSDKASFRSPLPEEIARAVQQSGAEGIIEFTHPSSVLNNIRALIPTRIPIVAGTTGWYNSVPEVEKLAHETGGYLLYSSNFSIGIHIFYKIVAEAARLFADFPEYDEAVFEAHHNQKADSPSGTALDIANLVLKNCPRKTEIVTARFDRPPKPDELHVASLRVGAVPGTHTVVFDSAADTIELTHRARSREGLASGAVHALEWLTDATHPCDPRHSRNGIIPQKPGIFTMEDVLSGFET